MLSEFALNNLPLPYAEHRIITDASGAAVDYIYLQCNTPFAELFGLDASEICEHRVSELLPDIREDPADWVGRYARIAGGSGSEQFEQYSQPLRRWFRVHAFQTAPGCFATIAEDIDDRVQIEREIHLRRRQQQEHGEQNRDVIFHYQFTPHAGFTSISPGIRELTGYSPDEFYSDSHQALRGLVHPDDWHIAEDMLQHPREYSRPTRLRWLNKNADTIWMELVLLTTANPDGSMSAIDGIARNITELRSAEEALRHSQLQQSQILTAISDMVMFYESDSMTIAWANRAAEETVGAEPGELIGKTCYEVWMRNAGSPCVDCPVRQCFATGRTSRGENSNATGQTWEITAYPLYSVSGHFWGVVETARDVTPRIRMEAELQKALDQADSANLVKDQFIANMSHELRTPLNGIIGVVELLLAETTTARESQRELLLLIQQSGQRLYNVVQEILSFSQLDSQQLDEQQMRFHLERVCREAAEAGAASACDHKLEFTLQLDPRLPEWVSGYPGKLRQILRHLLDNACKFTPAGRVTLEIRQAANRPLGIAFEVTDTGVGIPAELISRVCEPFFQAESGLVRSFGGVGLGLTIASRLAGELHGRLELRSLPGGGTSALCTIPFAAATGDAADMTWHLPE